MNISTINPDVQEFLTKVRAQLADLDPDERRDITDGLEADLSELAEERGIEALGDPLAYARELRQAAGLSPVMGRATERRPVGEAVGAGLDGARDRWERLVTGLPGKPWELVASLRPAWWVLRAWVAVQMIDLLWGSANYQGVSLIPSLDGAGLPLLVVAVVGSVQLGRGAWWPGTKSSVPARVLLLALNALAIGWTPVVIDSAGNEYGPDYDNGFSDGHAAAQSYAGEVKAGLYADGTWVSQIYPYDAAGKPLVGVQLFDQDGDPVNVVTSTECVYDAAEMPVDQGRQYFPWTDGASQKQNVFPVPSRVTSGDTPDPDPAAFTSGAKPSVGQFPFVSVPPISLPGLATSKGVTPKAAFVPGARPETPLNPIDNGC